MKYYKFVSGTPYCGTENEYYHKFKDEPKIDVLEELVGEYAQQAYEDYCYLHSGWNDENFDGMTEEEIEEYMDNFRSDCYCEWEEVTEEEYEENN